MVIEVIEVIYIPDWDTMLLIWLKASTFFPKFGTIIWKATVRSIKPGSKFYICLLNFFAFKIDFVILEKVIEEYKKHGFQVNQDVPGNVNTESNEIALR